ncbi:MAG: prepilin-type N-terminal cleavage/methylation domain-containing protein [Planctomycetales bacterium]
MRRNTRIKRAGFTLVEVLIVVVILGILAATVLPQFTTATGDAQETAIRQNLQTLRSLIQTYRMHHNDRVPAAGTTDAALFVDQLVKSSDADGTVGDIGTKPFGPYLVGQFPSNPYNNLRTVKVVNSATIGAADDGTGWLYSSVTGQLKANTATLTAADGTAIEAL